MRQKVPLNHTKTDLQLFQELPLGDLWPEAELVQVFCYLYRNSHLDIPPSWQSVLADFHREISEQVHSLADDL